MTLFNAGPLPAETPLDLGADSEDVEGEPMLFQASASFATVHGGPLTRTCLYALGEFLTMAQMLRVRIDTRSHMLMPGWYPAIPGWHCDFMRTDGCGRQVPDLARDAETRHFMLASAGPTCEFLDRRKLDLDVGPAFRWGELKVPDGSVLLLAPNTLIEFDAAELHRATPWVGPPGHWRYFFRASLFPKGDQHEVYANKIRKQTQVYCDVRAGW